MCWKDSKTKKDNSLILCLDFLLATTHMTSLQKMQFFLRYFKLQHLLYSFFELQMFLWLNCEALLLNKDDVDVYKTKNLFPIQKS